MQNSRKTILLSICSLFSVLLIGGFTYLKFGNRWSEVIPYWNDEALYFHLLEAMRKYGIPIGYNGYAGSHAPIGTYGFHGFFVLLPYLFMTVIFGLDTYTIAIVNAFLIVLGLFLFEIILKCSIEKMAVLLIVISFAPLVLVYVPTCMVEGVNYFWALLFAGLFISCIQKKTKIKLVSLLLVIVCATLMKVTWVSMLFPFFLLAINDENKGTKIIKALFGTLGGAIIGYAVFSMFSSPYFYSQIAKNIDLIINGAWLEFFYVIVNNLRGPIYAAIEQKSIFFIVAVVEIYGLLLWNMLMTIIMLVKKESGERLCIRLISLYVLVAYIGGCAVLYDGSLVAVRTIFPACIFAMAIEVYLLDKRGILVVVLLQTIAVVQMYRIHDTYEERGYYSVEYQKHLDEISHFLDTRMEIKPEKSYWGNTLGADVYIDSEYIVSAPSGCGINFYLEAPTENKPEYFLVRVENSDLIEQLLEVGYDYIETDSTVQLYQYTLN